MRTKRGRREGFAITRIFTLVILGSALIVASIATVETLRLQPLTNTTRITNSGTTQSSSTSSSSTTSTVAPATSSSTTTVSTSSVTDSTSLTRSASLMLNPTTGLPGSQFTFAFSGGSPNAQYFEESFSQPKFHFTTNPTGSFTGHVKVPPKTTPGFYDVSITDSSGNVVASATFTVL